MGLVANLCHGLESFLHVHSCLRGRGNSFTITACVLQGFLGSPTLFVLHINEFLETIKLNEQLHWRQQPNHRSLHFQYKMPTIADTTNSIYNRCSRKGFRMGRRGKRNLQERGKGKLLTPTICFPVSLLIYFSKYISSSVLNQ